VSEREEKWRTWKFLVMIECVALAIGLAMPITPSKTGSDFSLADWFFDDPSYLQEVFVYFLLTNLLIGVLALVAVVMIKVDKHRGA